MRHTEIEHKFLVGEDFDVGALRRAAFALGGFAEEVADVDVYYASSARPCVCRVRLREGGRQELTVKSRGGDSEVRAEVNLPLATPSSDGVTDAAAFLSMLGFAWVAEVRKAATVIRFGDCEVAHYVARSGGATVACVEFEAIDPPDEETARAVLARREAQLGFAGRVREERPLLDILGLTDAARSE